MLHNPSPLRRLGRTGATLGWIGPATALIAFAVIWPVYEMFRISFQHYSPDGFLLGSAGRKNYTKLFQDPNFGPVMLRRSQWTPILAKRSAVAWIRFFLRLTRIRARCGFAWFSPILS